MSASARPITPEQWRIIEACGILIGAAEREQWVLAPTDLNYAEAEVWGRERGAIERWDDFIALSSGETMVRLPRRTQAALAARIKTTATMMELARIWEGNIRAAPGADDDLASYGVTRPDWVKDPQPDDEIAIAVCVPYDLDHPLYFPDNRRGRCAGCRRPIQFRPSLPPGPEKLCPPCALRRARGDA